MAHSHKKQHEEKNSITGYVDDISLRSGTLKIRGWAIDNEGRTPDKLTVNLKRGPTAIEKTYRERRTDVRAHLNLDDDLVGFILDVEADWASSLGEIGPTIEVNGTSNGEPLAGRLRLTKRAARKIIYDKHLLISGIFGEKFTRVYPAVPGRTCVFFSNNHALEDEATSNGWLFRLVAGAPLSPDYRISSIQSKQIKFLQFFDEFPDFKDMEVFTYFDHKFYVQEDHVVWILNNMPPHASVLIRKTAGNKTKLEHEINAAMGQSRYAESMDATIAWLEKMKDEKGISENVRICNTGLIHYQNIPAIEPLLNEVHDTVHLLGQPECQIIWAAASQPYQDLIHTVDWNSLKPKWEAP